MITCLIPAYNEEKNIENTIKSIINTNIFDEIIVIDDDSKDKTNLLIKNFIKDNKNIKLIKNKYNLGKTKSILKGLKYSKGELIVLIDADLRGLNKENLEKLISPVRNNELDITIGSNIPFVLKRFSGLRCLKREVFDLLDKNKLKNSRYNLEEIINEAIKKFNLRAKYVKLNGVKNIHKIKKYGLINGIKLTLQMYFEILKNFFY
jgi:glycosyltransferase involved in cell wall biosynthesis